MSEFDLIEWLKTSIFGMVILGAIGSILAFFIINSFIYCATRWLSPMRGLAYRVFYHIIYGEKVVTEHFKGTHSSRELFVTMIIIGVFNIGMNIFLVTGLIVTILGSIHVKQDIELGQSLSFFGSFLTCTAGLMSIKSIRQLYNIYNIYMGPVEKSAINGIMSARSNKNDAD
ncbi:hypothetical protein [Aeromonas veronii]|uniref:hypothetical protein n=1 Tax=Aeromonas veronii TaxID=654 RepID=UPI003BA2716C